MKKRRRTIPLMFYVTPEERDQIEAKMAQLGTNNMSAYLRKIAIDGYVVQLDLPELREMVSLLRRSSNNLNQLARRANETGRIYPEDLADIRQNQAQRPVYTGLSIRILALFSVRKYDEIRTYKEVLL